MQKNDQNFYYSVLNCNWMFLFFLITKYNIVVIKQCFLMVHLVGSLTKSATSTNIPYAILAKTSKKGKQFRGICLSINFLCINIHSQDTNRNV